MKTALDCIPCFLRQVLEAVQMVSADPVVNERLVREMLHWTGEMDLSQPPPVFAQRLHRRLREISGVKDPYRAAKAHLNQMARKVAAALAADARSAEDPLTAAVRLAIAGNVIDLGAQGSVTAVDVHRAAAQALAEPLCGEPEGFRRAVGRARRILYLADNAGEIFFDRLLIEALSPDRVTLAVRGAPVLNDATVEDARTAGLQEICEVIDNGSDAPGTLLPDCSVAFRQQFEAADVIIAKGQGNFETLSEAPYNIFFLFKVKCPVIAAHAELPVGSHVLTQPRPARIRPGSAHSK